MAKSEGALRQVAADVAVRPLLADETSSILRAILSSCDYGVLLTDLEHRSLACNRKFGELFDIEPDEVVTCSVSGLRKRVMPFIMDRKAWLQHLDIIYADPDASYEDELRLRNRPASVLKRFSGPVRDSDGRVIGRLWTFRDVTAESKLAAMSRALLEVSTLHDPDPAVVTKKVLDSISRYFGGSTAIISIRKGDFMEFKAISGPFSPMKLVRGNMIQDSYCKFALQALEPFMVQNAKNMVDCAGMKPAIVGYTRYLGVPIRDDAGTATGTLCIIDRKSDEKLDDLDVQLMSMMGMRVSAELSREQIIRERLAEKDHVLKTQQSDLEETQRVLAAMNKAFSLVTEKRGRKAILMSQTRLLQGVLGYASSAVLLLEEQTLSGSMIDSRTTKPAPLSIPLEAAPSLREAIGNHLTGPGFEVLPSDPGLGTAYVTAACLPKSGRPWCVVLLGSDRPSRLADHRHSMHLNAIIDQVYLVLVTHLLQDQLFKTNEDLSQTHSQLVQSEKLSVVGTLAASTAHDIRNIVSSLTLLTAERSQRPEESLTAVREQLDRFNLLSHRLLSYAKPRFVASQTVDVGSILDRVLSLARVQLEILGVRASVTSDVGIPPIQGDPNQLEHLFLNLVLNAGHAMRKDGGELSVTVRRRAGVVEIQVSDTGSGLSREVANSLFQPFTSSNPDGFGLGLFSCKRIVEAHAGTISAKSNRVKGTTFIVQLPSCEDGK
jgi:signal transduction histidine kinase